MQIHGTVVHIDQPYAAKPIVSIPHAIARLAFAIVLVPVALILWLLSGVLSSNRGRPTFVSEVAGRAAGYWAGQKLIGNTVIVRDVRVQDVAGKQWLVRICGHLKRGSLNFGDVVTVDGVDRQGTLLFRGGINHTIRSRLVAT